MHAAHAFSMDANNRACCAFSCADEIVDAGVWTRSTMARKAEGGSWHPVMCAKSLRWTSTGAPILLLVSAKSTRLEVVDRAPSSRVSRANLSGAGPWKVHRASSRRKASLSASQLLLISLCARSE